MDLSLPQVGVAGIKTVSLVDGEAVVRVEADLGGQRSELEISISSDLAPLMALALLATIAAQRAERDGLAPALDALAVGVVATPNPEKVRLHVLFDRGAVLPIELPQAAADALRKALTVPLDSGLGNLG